MSTKPKGSTLVTKCDSVFILQAWLTILAWTNALSLLLSWLSHHSGSFICLQLLLKPFSSALLLQMLDDSSSKSIKTNSKMVLKSSSASKGPCHYFFLQWGSVITWQLGNSTNVKACSGRARRFKKSARRVLNPRRFLAPVDVKSSLFFSCRSAGARRESSRRARPEQAFKSVKIWTDVRSYSLEMDCNN